MNSEAVRRAVASAPLAMAYGKSFILRQDYAAIDEEAAREIVRSAFEKIALRGGNQISRQAEAHGLRDIPLQSFGISHVRQSGKDYLVPSLGGIGMPELKCEFTAFVSVTHQVAPPLDEIIVDLGDVRMRPVGNPEEAKEMASAAGIVVASGVMEIGSAGCRSTNWDTAYSLHISGASAAGLQRALSWFTDITNRDERNVVRSPGKETYDLTQRKEVACLMGRMGLGRVYERAVCRVKEHEERMGLKDEIHRKGRLRNYAKRSLMVTERLADYRQDVLRHVLKVVEDNIGAFDAGTVENMILVDPAGSL